MALVNKFSNMKAAACILALAVLAQGSLFLENLKIDGKNCDTGSSIYEINKFVVSPDPPKKNGNISLDMSGIMHSEETLKSMDTFIKFNGINFYQENFPEKGTYSQGEECPITLTVYLPGIAPDGKYAVQVKLKNDDGDYLSCWEYDFQL